MAGLTLKGIEKIYGADVRILRGIDLEIANGEFLVLVGPSGCGKSTLLRMIAGLEDISAGELYIDGVLSNQKPPKDRDVAMVFQSYALYPHMTVRENMGFSLSIRKAPKASIDKSVNDAARLLGLTDYLDRLPKQLSGGQRQRVAIGRAIVRRPKVFLFDEPLSNLDANLRAQMRVELKKLHQTLGVTMIYVTHDQIEAMTLADRICVLEGGFAQQVDTPLNLYERPTNTFVAEFIGSPPMNFLTLDVDDSAYFNEDAYLPHRNKKQSDQPKQIKVGIRPHELTLDGRLEGKIDAVVEVIETVGWDLHLHCRMSDKELIAQVTAENGRSLKPGDRITLRVDPQAVKLFDAETNRALPYEGRT
jgi:ABC-type sugar transport system ATPase subunit